MPTTHSFVWFEIFGEPEALSSFYAGALGWTVQTVPMGEQRYHMFSPPQGAPQGGFRTGDPRWLSYMAVPDVDAAAADVVANGGALLEPAQDMGPGRMALVAEPTGAVFALWREAQPDEAQDAAPGLGSVQWTECFSSDVDRSLAFFQQSFGLGNDTMPMPSGGAYNMLKSGEKRVGGAVQDPHEGNDSHWLNWVSVQDVDATAAAIEQHGGSLVAPAWDQPGMGRMAIARDPAGTRFGIMALG